MTAKQSVDLKGIFLARQWLLGRVGEAESVDIKCGFFTALTGKGRQTEL